MKVQWLNKISSLDPSGLLKELPLNQIEVISWVKFAKQATVILQESQRPTMRQKNLSEFLAKSDSLFKSSDSSLLGVEKWADLSVDARVFWTERIYFLYWNELIKNKIINLDWRPSRFKLSADIESPQAKFEPSRFFHRFDEGFVKSLSDLHQGFLFHRPKTVDKALRDLELLGPKETSDELLEIISMGIPGGDDQLQKFDPERFKKSFPQLATYLAKHGRKLKPEFMWWGLSTLGLFQTFSILDAEFSPQSVLEPLLGV